jgi:hypothetical protein
MKDWLKSYNFKEAAKVQMASKTALQVFMHNSFQKCFE